MDYVYCENMTHPRFAKDLVEVVANGSNKVRNYMHRLEEDTADFREHYLGSFQISLDTKEVDVVKAIQLEITKFRIFTGRRIAELLTETIKSLNNRNLQVAALVTRACLESCAAAVYANSKLSEKLRGGISSQDELNELSDLLDRLVRSGRFNWISWFQGGNALEGLLAAYAKDPKSAEPSLAQVNVLTMLERLDKVVTSTDSKLKGQVHLIYSILSDICHPAIGATILSLDPKVKAGQISLASKPVNSIVRFYCLSTTIPALVTVVGFAYMALKNLDAIQHRLQIKPL